MESILSPPFQVLSQSIDSSQSCSLIKVSDAWPGTGTRTSTHNTSTRWNPYIVPTDLATLARLGTDYNLLLCILFFFTLSSAPNFRLHVLSCVDPVRCGSIAESICKLSPLLVPISQLILPRFLFLLLRSLSHTALFIHSTISFSRSEPRSEPRSPACFTESHSCCHSLAAPDKIQLLSSHTRATTSSGPKDIWTCEVIRVIRMIYGFKALQPLPWPLPLPLHPSQKNPGTPRSTRAAKLRRRGRRESEHGGLP